MMICLMHSDYRSSFDTVTALKTAVENGEGSFDKEATSHNDLFNAFRLSLMLWQ
jgi:hypothetical protein